MIKLKFATIFASMMLALPTFFPELVHFGLPFRVAFFIGAVIMITVIIFVDVKDRQAGKG